LQQAIGKPERVAVVQVPLVELKMVASAAINPCFIGNGKRDFFAFLWSFAFAGFYVFYRECVGVFGMNWHPFIKILLAVPASPPTKRANCPTVVASKLLLGEDEFIPCMPSPNNPWSVEPNSLLVFQLDHTAGWKIVVTVKNEVTVLAFVSGFIFEVVAGWIVKNMDHFLVNLA